MVAQNIKCFDNCAGRVENQTQSHRNRVKSRRHYQDGGYRTCGIAHELVARSSFREFSTETRHQLAALQKITLFVIIRNGSVQNRNDETFEIENLPENDLLTLLELILHYLSL